MKKELDALTADLGNVARYANTAIDLAQQCADAYRQTPDHDRRMFNQVLFERIEVYMDEDDEHQVRAILAPPFDKHFSSILKHIVYELQGRRKG
ncbi:hypothetical protein [Mycetocola saprophilus]|uniref:hypothetical protein n=1 Tax=Mycetocola saprophilus TaxID=76636 RepID=UPI003BF26C3B